MNPTLQHIVCVDDEEDILQVAKLALEAVGGFRVSLCKGSEDAVACIRDHAPDLVLLDVMMPNMDGPTTLATLRAQGDTTPVIFMTAKAQQTELQYYMGLGAIGVISKPFDPMTLSSEIRTLWENKGERPHG